MHCTNPANTGCDASFSLLETGQTAMGCLIGADAKRPREGVQPEAPPRKATAQATRTLQPPVAQAVAPVDHAQLARLVAGEIKGEVAVAVGDEVKLQMQAIEKTLKTIDKTAESTKVAVANLGSGTTRALKKGRAGVWPTWWVAWLVGGPVGGGGKRCKGDNSWRSVAYI